MDFNAVWSGLQETIHAMITLLPISRTAWQYGYSDIYLLCTAKGDASFHRLYAETKQLLIDHVAKLFSLVQEGGDSQLIKNYYKYWTEYSIGSKHLKSLFGYFNRYRMNCRPSIMATTTTLAIGELTLEVWRDGMIAPLGPKLATLLLEAIDEDRQCQSTSLPVETIRETVLSFVDVNIYHKTDSLELYKELFEEPYLKASDEHLTREIARLFEGKDASIYMEEIIQKFEEELSLARKFLHSTSLPKITHQIETLQRLNSKYKFLYDWNVPAHIVQFCETTCSIS